MLKLESVGKIYTDGGIASVGFHNVSLTFDCGEFVVLTGASGAGKSSLLHVIGGLDSFEEGEIYYCGKPLSSFNEGKRDEFRDQNVSFVFQDYNILESLTVRDNVEIALPESLGKREKRRKANEVLRLIGMLPLAGRKAGRLSGGQKQRVSIARALAMNRSILLADEPIAHLDEETAQDIVALLAAAAKDHLVIVSTHDADAFLHMATRTIRMADGAVAEDTKELTLEQAPNLRNSEEKSPSKVEKSRVKNNHKGRKKNCMAGISLGNLMIAAKPRFFALLLLLFFVCGSLLYLFTGAFAMIAHRYTAEDGTLFRGGSGRIVVTHKDGTPVTEEEAANLAARCDAESFESCDILIDSGSESEWFFYMKNPEQYDAYVNSAWTPPYRVVKNEDFGVPDIGRYPQEDSECFLYVPYALSDYYGRNDLSRRYEKLYGVEYKIAGIKYYSENDTQGKILLTSQGYKTCALMAYIGQRLSCRCIVFESDNILENIPEITVKYDYSANPSGMLLQCGAMDAYNLEEDGRDIRLSFYYRSEDDKYEGKLYLDDCFNKEALLKNQPEDSFAEDNTLIVNPQYVYDLLERYGAAHYPQCTLIFSSETQAEKALEILKGAGYLAATGEDCYALGRDTLRDSLLPVGIASAGEILVFAIMGFVVHMFISRIMQSMRYEVTVMRAIGVKSRTVKQSIYYRFLLPLAAAALPIIAIALLLHRTSFFSKYLLWLRIGPCLFLLLEMLLVVCVAVETLRRKYLEVSIQNALKGEI